MITYDSSKFGLYLLLRLHGSALIKASAPSFLSTAAMLAVHFGTGQDYSNSQPIKHPYVIGCIMVAFTFLLVFRANFSYHRYWDSFTHLHQMHSKWLDAGISVSAFHYQSSRYDRIRPPAFGKYPEVNSLQMRHHEMMTPEELSSYLESTTKEDIWNDKNTSFRCRKRSSEANKTKKRRLGNNDYYIPNIRGSIGPGRGSSKVSTKFKPQTGSFCEKDASNYVERVDGGSKNTNKPSLFLQELAHLLSLLSAVALSTLRADAEGTESPLADFVPGEPWPPVDPDTYSSQYRKAFAQESRCKNIGRYMCGISRDTKYRTLYNAARPFRVIGGVSDAECRMLQRARGPTAKVAMCAMWLQEFISREHLNGATGNVGPPIISRVYQFISDGNLGYNQCRKIAYIPFPFAHAQLVVIFVVIISVFIPMLMLCFVSEILLAAVINFFTVMCFVGLHEVAKELESPFKNAPNDAPLNNFQAQFNEAIISVFLGFHPDSWWEISNETDNITAVDTFSSDSVEKKERRVNDTISEIIDQV